MNTENPNTPNRAVNDGQTAGPEVAVTEPGGTYRAVAVFLALIVVAALAYGLVLTAIKATALFTGL